MSLWYRNVKNLPPLICSKDPNTFALTGVALTSTYQSETSTHPTKSFGCGGFPKVNFDISYVTGASETGTTICFKIEDCPELNGSMTNFFRLENESISAGVSTLTDREFQRAGGAGTTTYNFSLGLDIFYRNCRISFKESGVSSNAGTVYCEATIHGA